MVKAPHTRQDVRRRGRVWSAKSDWQVGLISQLLQQVIQPRKHAGDFPFPGFRYAVFLLWSVRGVQLRDVLASVELRGD